MELHRKKLSKEDARMDELLGLMTTGRFSDVVTLCVAYLKRKKNRALDYVLGHALIRMGDEERGFPLINRGSFISVKDPYCLYRLGYLAYEVGHLKHSFSCFKKTIHIDPNFWEAMFYLAHTLKRQFKHKEALECYLKVLKLKPDLDDAFFNAGQIYEILKDYQKAEEFYYKFYNFNQNDPEVLSALGRCFYENSNPEQAYEFWGEAIKINPKSAAAHNDIVNRYILNGEFEEAQIRLDAAIEAGVEHETIYLNMGRILYMTAQDKNLIIKVYEQGIEKYPRVPELWSALLGLMIDNARYEEAEAILNDLFATGMGIWYLKLAMTRILFETSRLSEAESIMDELLKLEPNNGMFNSSLLAFKTYNSKHTAEELFAAHKKHGALIEEGRKGDLVTRKYCGGEGKLIKIGYVSPDFREHATSRFIEPIIANHDRSKFHITLYSQSKFIDNTTQRLQGFADEWCPTYSLDDFQLAQKVQEDEIDILVDLAGHTPGNRLGAFAYKPAPVQVSFVGYPYTTGMKSIDYYLADKNMVPEEAQKHFVEEIVYLPFSHEKKRLSKMGWLPAGVKLQKELPCINSGVFTFGCFNRIEKMSDKLLDCWIEILSACPSSRLLLMNRNFDSESIQENYMQKFIQGGVAEDRLDFRPSANLKNYLSGFNEMDLGLDTYPYNGSTVSCDSLKMGVPFVTLEGEASQSKVGSSLLIAQGYDGYATSSYEQYIQKAIEVYESRDDLILHRQNLILHSEDPWNEGVMDWAVVPLEEVFDEMLAVKR